MRPSRVENRKKMIVKAEVYFETEGTYSVEETAKLKADLQWFCWQAARYAAVPTPDGHDTFLEKSRAIKFNPRGKFISHRIAAAKILGKTIITK